MYSQPKEAASSNGAGTSSAHASDEPPTKKFKLPLKPAGSRRVDRYVLARDVAGQQVFLNSEIQQHDYKPYLNKWDFVNHTVESE